MAACPIDGAEPNLSTHVSELDRFYLGRLVGFELSRSATPSKTPYFSGFASLQTPENAQNSAIRYVLGTVPRPEIVVEEHLDLSSLY